MEINRTAMHTQNEFRQSQMTPAATGPTHCNLDTPEVFELRADDDLIQAAKLGDRDAFAELCRRHSQFARQKILSIVRHREDAEDALQETLLCAFSNLGSFRQSSKFSTWITAIGINAALTVLRKRKSRREIDIEPNSSGEVVWDFIDEAPDPERSVATRQLLLLLQTELHALPPQTREVMTSCFGQDHSRQEAADALGMSVAAFKSRLLRGRRSLRSSFEQKGVLSSCP